MTDIFGYASGYAAGYDDADNGYGSALESAAPSVDPADIVAERANGWVNFHPEKFCHRCGQRNVRPWFTDSALWNEVLPEELIVCPQCFTELYEALHPNCVWELRLEAPTRNGSEAT